jgi:hypothetical protein
MLGCSLCWQGQTALKMIGFERGVTVQSGLPVPIMTPAHGTAYDIVGKVRSPCSTCLVHKGLVLLPSKTALGSGHGVTRLPM